jgi:hypothetical protein
VDRWHDKPKTEMPGELLWVAYAPVMEWKGVDDDNDDNDDDTDV